ncbi:hypothetical protein CK203_061699 [Vitis vinifera]|uniref:Retrotransposon gag domain-containing protein n=1 Tax=Vitis vinifera TaxID=29760 RepID=A0A438G827_VITVI|nr:hypothetical protein CK203_061699 [Vitis vinifera]
MLRSHKQNISTLQNIKMQDNESLREFVKRFGQAVLQVEAYSMDAVLQIFKRSICPGTPFFESLAKKPPTTMDDLFRRASKYSMLEDDVRAATSKSWLPDSIQKWCGKKCQTSGPAKAVRSKAGRAKSPGNPLTPLSISYEKLLPMIQDMSDFRCLHYLVERLIKAGHLKQYLRSDARGRDASEITTLEPQGPAAPKAIINYINGGPSTRSTTPNERDKGCCGQHRCVSVSTPSAWDNWGGPRPIDGTIIFPPVDPTRILQPHRDALILSLEIGDFDVRRILVDPGSSADLVQASVISHMGAVSQASKTLGESCPDSTERQLLPWEILYRSKLAQSLSTYNFRWYKIYHPSMSSWGAHGCTT